jgi:hypothetical protein
LLECKVQLWIIYRPRARTKWQPRSRSVC